MCRHTCGVSLMGMGRRHAPPATPYARLEMPDARLATPCARLEMPDVRLATPCARLEMPDVRLATPCARLEMPDVRLATPCARLEMPDVRLAAHPLSPLGHMRQLERMRRSSSVRRLDWRSLVLA